VCVKAGNRFYGLRDGHETLNKSKVGIMWVVNPCAERNNGDCLPACNCCRQVCELLWTVIVITGSRHLPGLLALYLVKMTKQKDI